MQRFTVVVTTKSGTKYTFMPKAVGVIYSREGGPQSDVEPLGELKTMPKIEVGKSMWGYNWLGSMAFVTSPVTAVEIR